MARRGRVLTYELEEEVESMGVNTISDARQSRKIPRRHAETLSIVIPAYQEERFIGGLLEKVIAVDLSRLASRKRLSWWTTARETERRRSRRDFPEVKSAPQGEERR